MKVSFVILLFASLVILYLMGALPREDTRGISERLLPLSTQAGNDGSNTE